MLITKMQAKSGRFCSSLVCMGLFRYGGAFSDTGSYTGTGTLMSLDNNWFTEICQQHGSAFSLRIKQKLHEEQTPYQRIEIYDTDTFGKLMTIDGFYMVSTRDNFLYHEMMSHPALFSHDNPEHVVIVGGGDCGTLREVLKHTQVKQAWQIEIDERVTRLAEQYFPELCDSNDDPRAHLHFEDAIEWIKNAESGSLDVIIVDSTDPIGPAEGLFSEPFYRDCLRALKDGGIIVQQSESPLFHMGLLGDMHVAMHAAGYRDVRSLQFPQCIYPSGWWSATLARKGRELNTFREQDVVNKNFATQYYDAAMHTAAFAMPPFFQAEIKRRLKK